MSTKEIPADCQISVIQRGTFFCPFPAKFEWNLNIGGACEKNWGTQTGLACHRPNCKSSDCRSLCRKFLKILCFEQSFYCLRVDWGLNPLAHMAAISQVLLLYIQESYCSARVLCTHSKVVVIG